MALGAPQATCSRHPMKEERYPDASCGNPWPARHNIKALSETSHSASLQPHTDCRTIA